DSRHYFEPRKNRDGPSARNGRPRGIQRPRILAGKSTLGQQVMAFFPGLCALGELAPRARPQAPFPGSIEPFSPAPNLRQVNVQRAVPAITPARPRAREPRRGFTHVSVLGGRRLDDRLAPRPPGYAREFGRRA